MPVKPKMMWGKEEKKVMQSFLSNRGRESINKMAKRIYDQDLPIFKRCTFVALRQQCYLMSYMTPNETVSPAQPRRPPPPPLPAHLLVSQSDLCRVVVGLAEEFNVASTRLVTRINERIEQVNAMFAVMHETQKNVVKEIEKLNARLEHCPLLPSPM